MPVVATVGGVKVVFYANEHPPPHFHVKYGEHIAVIEIETLEVVRGYLPVSKRRTILAWAETRKAKLSAAFLQATSHERVEAIE